MFGQVSDVARVVVLSWHVLDPTLIGSTQSVQQVDYLPNTSH